ncbi:MAG TPA: type II toxin-antitoxin system RelE/ParE family toxin [Longimicrobium sp.]
MKGRISDAASEDIREARAFVFSKFGRQARQGLNAEIRRGIALLREHPLAGKPAGRMAREHVLDGYPYSIIYHVGQDEVVIAALYHHRRDPAFWHNRFGPGR